MKVTRRETLLSGLFGASWLGIRALATGLPASLLLNPERALAYGVSCFDKGKAQYIVFNTLASGDPSNANAPGSFDHPEIVHPDPATYPEMAKTAINLGGKSVFGAKAWAALPPEVLSRAAFIHHATLTNAHPNQPKVMKLMGAVKRQEMLLSLLAKHLAPCLGTVQSAPVVIGANGPSEALSYEGRDLPIVRPTALKAILTSPKGPLTDLQKMRDEDLNRINALFKKHGTASHKRFLDDLATSQTEVRSISQDLLESLTAVTSDGPPGQITAAVALIRMNVSPVVSVRIPFGGDNHSDAEFANESAQTTQGVQSIATLMNELKGDGLADKVSFAFMNVFGRTLTNKHRPEATRRGGRDHFASHHVTVLIGKGVKGGVYGGVGVRMAGADVSALPINSTTGKGDMGGDIAFDDTLGAVGKTIGAAVGVDAKVLDDQITQGKMIRAALV